MWIWKCAPTKPPHLHLSYFHLQFTWLVFVFRIMPFLRSSFSLCSFILFITYGEGKDSSSGAESTNFFYYYCTPVKKLLFFLLLFPRCHSLVFFPSSRRGIRRTAKVEKLLVSCSVSLGENVCSMYTCMWCDHVLIFSVYKDTSIVTSHCLSCTQLPLCMLLFVVVVIYCGSNGIIT